MTTFESIRLHGAPACSAKPACMPPSVPLPGDESITLRALAVASLYPASLELENPSAGPDAQALARGLRAIGAPGAFHSTALPIDCGGSTEVAELLMGLIAGREIEATLVGDGAPSLEPTAAQLRAFGALVETTNGTLPVAIRGTAAPQTRSFLLVAPSSATRSALLLAARGAGIPIAVGGDKAFDDVTERLFAYLDATGATSIAIPGDFGEAAQRIVDTVLAPGASARLDAVNVNPYRAGLLDVLAAMGAPVARANQREVCGLPVADLVAAYSPLRGITIAGDLLARSRPEFALLARLAAGAAGETRILGRGLSDPGVPFERLPNGIAFPGRDADTSRVSETTA
jgi:3-phosphoshikimate 1-carboxyvinyltransferase